MTTRPRAAWRVAWPTPRPSAYVSHSVFHADCHPTAVGLFWLLIAAQRLQVEAEMKLFFRDRLRHLKNELAGAERRADMAVNARRYAEEAAARAAAAEQHAKRSAAAAESACERAAATAFSNGVAVGRE